MNFGLRASMDAKNNLWEQVDVSVEGRSSPIHKSPRNNQNNNNNSGAKTDKKNHDNPYGLPKLATDILNQSKIFEVKSLQEETSRQFKNTQYESSIDKIENGMPANFLQPVNVVDKSTT